MKYSIEAYEALIDQLKEKLEKADADYEKIADRCLTTNEWLTRQLVKMSGKEAAMEVAREIDKRFKVGWEEWVDEEF